MVAKLTLVGNLGVDPEVRYSADGKPVLSFRVASNYRRRDAETRDWVDATNWYRVTTFGRLAERLSEQVSGGRLIKGSRVIIFGRLEATAYMDRNNQPQPSLDVVADDVLFAENRPRAEGEFGSSEFESTPVARSSQPRPQHIEESTDLEDLPF
jgi:single-strand DNA-binding protein